MRKKYIIDKLTDIALVLEIILTVLLAIGIAIGLIDIVKYFVSIFMADAVTSYSVFKQFLAHTLLIVVGVELMLMLISHSINSMLELILFVIARKMLIYGDTMMDLVLGTIAIAILFITIKYVPLAKSFVSRDKEEGEYSASTTIRKLMKETGIKLPIDKGHTLGGLAFNLTNGDTSLIQDGAEFELGNIRLKILKSSDGVIERVKVEKLDQEANDIEVEK